VSAGQSGAETADRVYEAISPRRSSGPPGELDAFRGRVVAHQYRYLYALCARTLPEPRAVLDWGCGDGHFSYFLLAAGHRVTSFTLQHRPKLFDVLPERLAARHDFVRGDPGQPSRLPLADGAFEAVFSVGVLEHVRETGGTEEASLAELHRVLKPEGLLVCFHLPNRWSYIEAASRWLKRRPASAETCHRFRFAVSDIRKLCAAGGFALETHRRYGFLPRNVLSALPRRLRDSPHGTRGFNRIDAGLEAILPWVCQNHGFTARRLATPASSSAR
jgi:SAM-dependent methyltransferase